MQSYAGTSGPCEGPGLQTRAYSAQAAQDGLDTLDSVLQRSMLEGNRPYHPMRGTFAAELGQTASSLATFRQAAKLALLPVERDFLARRVEEREAAKHI
jgi:predicted RNA polymerase sigma factor